MVIVRCVRIVGGDTSLSIRHQLRFSGEKKCYQPKHTCKCIQDLGSKAKQIPSVMKNTQKGSCIELVSHTNAY